MTKFFLLDLILFLIFGGVAIILQYHFGNRLSKKVEIVYGCISAGIELTHSYECGLFF